MSDDEKYDDIPPLIEIIIERRAMTVRELIDALQGYPADSLIHICIEDCDSSLLEIKEVSSSYELGTGNSSPVLAIDKVKIKEAYGQDHS